MTHNVHIDEYYATLTVGYLGIKGSFFLFFFALCANLVHMSEEFQETRQAYDCPSNTKKTAEFMKHVIFLPNDDFAGICLKGHKSIILTDGVCTGQCFVFVFFRKFRLPSWLKFLPQPHLSHFRRRNGLTLADQGT